MDAHTRNIGSAITISRKTIEQIQSIRTDLRICVGKKKVQSTTKLFVHAGLQAMVITAAVGRGVARVLGEVGERQPSLGCR